MFCASALLLSIFSQIVHILLLLHLLHYCHHLVTICVTLWANWNNVNTKGLMSPSTVFVANALYSKTCFSKGRVNWDNISHYLDISLIFDVARFKFACKHTEYREGVKRIECCDPEAP